MTKEIIVNAGEAESRVAILENGRLMELHVERDPKIVGNIYKGRVTKVLKGMDAAFVEIGIERNAFLSVSDVVSDDDDDGGGRNRHRVTAPINELLHAGQEIMVQVVRAPVGTKGARVTTRLSIPGRYMVLMLNGGGHVGVSRKIEDPRERQRLRAVAESLRIDKFSIIVRTEAMDRTDEELKQDLSFLIDLAERIEEKAKSTPAPALIHGDLTLIFRLIRDAFTRDVNRVVVDSPETFESIVEMVEVLMPRMKNRIFLYEDPTPLFHAYNIEPEVERTLRRKVWLPSGGYLIIDQAEALTAIDVNTGRFVGSVDLNETVLTTNLQAAEEVARQLRLRDLGGIIVVDFIDMDNLRHRQQVTKAFDDALRNDRAKIKVHSIGPLGLVEMTRKRTGDSLAGLLTESCPYCSGIGRIQTATTMALRIQREIAAQAAQYPQTETYLLKAHPRIIASILGFEGEAHRDLEEYIGHPVYMRVEESFHPNAYTLERLTFEQALGAVVRIEEDTIIEGRIVTPDPELSADTLLFAEGQFIIAPGLEAPVGTFVRVKVELAGTSLAKVVPPPGERIAVRQEKGLLSTSRPPLVPESMLPAYLRDEAASVVSRTVPLLSPTAEGVPIPEADFVPSYAQTYSEPEEAPRGRNRRGIRGSKKQEIVFATPAPVEIPVESIPLVLASDPFADDLVVDMSIDPFAEEGLVGELTPEEVTISASARRRRRRRKGGKKTDEVEATGAVSVEPIEMIVEELLEAEETIAMEIAAIETVLEEGENAAVTPRKRRRRGGRRHRRSTTGDALVTGEAEVSDVEEDVVEVVAVEEPAAIPEIEPPTPTRKRRAPRRLAKLEAVAGIELPPLEITPIGIAEAPPVIEAAIPEPVVTPKPKRAPRKRTPKKVEEPVVVPEPVEEPVLVIEEAAPKPKRAPRKRAPKKQVEAAE